MGAISSMTPVATSTFTPGSVTPQTQSTPQMQLSTPLQQRQSTSTSTASNTSASMGSTSSASTTTTSDIQVLGSIQPDNPKTEQFQFSPPQKIDWNNPPGKHEDEDDEDFPDVSM